MLKSILKIVGRIVLILVVAGVVAGLTYGVSKAVNITPRFGREADRERFQQQQPGSLPGQPGQPPRQFRGDDEGREGGGSLLRGIGDVLMNATGIAIFTLAGWFIFRRYRRRLPDAA